MIHKIKIYQFKNIVAEMLRRDSGFEVDWDDKFLDKVRISYKDATDGSTETKRLILINKDQITKVLEEVHSKSYVCNITTPETKEYVQACAECQKNRIEQEKHVLLHPLQVPVRPWNNLSIDFNWT
ncbi:hypothetical protein ACTFIW_010327 [Dictyostelium discoideum]